MIRPTDIAANALQAVAAKLAVFTRADYGLPITLTGAVQVAATSSAVLSITIPTDSYVRSILHTVLLDANGSAVSDAFLDRVDVAGFQIYDAQTATVPLLNPVNAAGVPSANGQFSPLNTVGFPRGFKLRQGDTIEFTFTSNNAAATRGSVQVDAFRIDQMHPA